VNQLCLATSPVTLITIVTLGCIRSREFEAVCAGIIPESLSMMSSLFVAHRPGGRCFGGVCRCQRGFSGELCAAQRLFSHKNCSNGLFDALGRWYSCVVLPVDTLLVMYTDRDCDAFISVAAVEV
jgi:hypothetical protein